LTYKEWRQRARIMVAVEALAGGNVSIKQIAARTGFASPAAFGHAFRQVMGMTPGDFISRAIEAWER
jgi:AraC-like DNA-binding protein